MEIEAKIALSSEQCARLRARLGAPASVHRQRDTYLRTAGLPVALRVREEDERAWVTLKAGFEQVAGVRVREEIEPAIDPAQAADWLRLFDRLGLPAGLVVEKRRASHAFMGVTVALDEVAELGTFVEVEALADEAPAALVKLEAAMRALELDGLPRVTESYRELLAAARAAAER